MSKLREMMEAQITERKLRNPQFAVDIRNLIQKYGVKLLLIVNEISDDTMVKNGRAATEHGFVTEYDRIRFRMAWRDASNIKGLMPKENFAKAINREDTKINMPLFNQKI